MKMKRCLPLLLALLMLGTILTGCGGSSNAMTDKAASREMVAAESPVASNGLTGTTEPGSDSLPEGRKWVITIDMDVETEDLDSLMAALDKTLSSLDGYVEDQSVHNGSTYSSRRYRSANFTVRIPDEKVDQFTQEVSSTANVVSQNLNREDITLRYVATSSRVTALETEQARLLELLEQAETMADLLEIEARLTDVRYELENYASQLRLYDNQVDYATINLYIEEVQEYTPVEEPTFLERITDGFRASLKGLADAVVDVTVWFLVNSPYLAVFAVLGLILMRLVKRIRKPKAMKHPPKKEDQT